jgi:FemAB-related protein (PEP-CTERM system-associated)
MRVERVHEPGAEWDAFVESTPGAALSHAAAWAQVLRAAYGLEPCYLAARHGSGALAGVLPLVRFRSLGGRRELVSMPFLDTGGILARSGDAATALLDAALRLTRETRARVLELRQPEPLHALPSPSSLEPAYRSNLVLPLQQAEEAQWKEIGAKVRNQTRKAEREGLRIAAGDPSQLAREFYQPFSVNMRDLGSPVHAERFYRMAAQHFGERLRFIVVRDGQRSIGGLVAIRYADTVTVTWASTLRSERSRCPNNLIYWEALRWAIRHGAHAFDFGRSRRDGGTYRFKRGWGAEDRPLAWVRLNPAGDPIELTAAADHVVLKELSSLWSRLPVPVSVFLGPRLRRFLSN